ncbi:MAG TPA: NAD(P)H-dependent oxidoreductase subunit E, partial [Leptolinea sp.]
MENIDTIILPELSMFFSTLHSQSGNGRTALIPCLHAAQDLYGYIPEEVIRNISHNLEIPV